MTRRRSGSFAARRLPGAAVGQLGRQLAQHAEIVAGLEPRRGDQRRAAGLVQRVFEFGQPIGRVDVDEDQPGLGGGELGHDPFGVVRRPDADALAAFEAERDQAGGEGVDPLPQLPPAPADFLMTDDQRVALAKALDGLVEIDADRLADQRRLAGAVDIAQPGHRHSHPNSGLHQRRRIAL